MVVDGKIRAILRYNSVTTNIVKNYTCFKTDNVHISTKYLSRNEIYVIFYVVHVRPYSERSDCEIDLSSVIIVIMIQNNKVVQNLNSVEFLCNDYNDLFI